MGMNHLLNALNELAVYSGEFSYISSKIDHNQKSYGN